MGTFNLSWSLHPNIVKVKKDSLLVNTTDKVVIDIFG